MSSKKKKKKADENDAAPKEELAEYPGGITEKHGRVPLFLKLTYVGFVSFAIIYLILYFSGDGSPLVQVLNEVTANGAP